MGLAAAALVGALTLAACGSNDSGSGNSSGGSGSGGSAAASNLKIGMAYDIGGRGDKSFNDSAAVGLDTAKKQFNLSDSNVKELSARAGETDTDRATRLELLAKSGFNPIVAVGFAYAPALKTVAPKYPDVKFGIIDATPDDVKAPNVSNLTFAEEQGSFLVGAAAGLKTTSGTVGFIGGCSVPLIAKFEAGYKAGVQAAKPGTKVVTKYLSTPQQNCSGFNDPAAGQEAAKGMYDGGADIVYAAAGGSGSGVFSAAAAANKKAIGVDSDQYLSADPAVQKTIMTSMVKRVNVAVLKFLTEAKDGNVKSGQEVFDLKVDGVGYATSGGQVDDIKSKLDAYKQQIVDGQIKVPTTVS